MISVMPTSGFLYWAGPPSEQASVLSPFNNDSVAGSEPARVASIGHAASSGAFSDWSVTLNRLAVPLPGLNRQHYGYIRESQMMATVGTCSVHAASQRAPGSHSFPLRLCICLMATLKLQDDTEDYLDHLMGFHRPRFRSRGVHCSSHCGRVHPSTQDRPSLRIFR